MSVINQTFYTKFKSNISSPVEIVATTPGVLKIALLEFTHVPDLDVHDFWNDVSGDEIPATGGYTAGGKTITTLAATEVSGTAVLTGDMVTWTNLTASWGFAMLYLDTGTPSTSRLVCMLQWDEERVWPGVDYSLVWPSAANGGIMSIG